jgi:hypothetical protein
MIVLHHQTAFIPSHALPGLLKRRGGHRGHQNPGPSALLRRASALPTPE